MPTVTQYGDSQVSTQVTPGAKSRALPGAAFDLGGKGLTDLAAGFDQMQERIDTTAAEEALVGFERAKNDMFFNPESGYFNSMGRDAFDKSKETSDNLTKLQQETAKNLTGNARIMFDRAAAAHVTRANADISRHSAKQFQAWEVATIKAGIENAMEGAALYWNDPKRLSVQKELGRFAVIKAAEKQGLDPTEELQTFESGFAKNTIIAATAHSAESGAAALEKYGDALEEGTTVMAEKIETKRRTTQARDKANEAIVISAELSEKYDGLPDERQLVNADVKELSKNDPELAGPLARQMSYVMNSKAAAKKELNSNTMEAGLKFQQNGGSVDQFIAQNPEAWYAMDVAQQNVVRAGVPVVTVFEEFSRIMLLKPEELKDINPADYSTKFSDADLLKLQNAVKSARAGTAEHQIGRSRAVQVSSAVERLFGKTSTRKGKKVDRADQFHALVTAEEAFRKDQKKAELTSVEFTEMINELTRKVAVEDAGFMFFDADKTVADMTVDDTRLMTKILHGAGKRATADNLLNEQDRVQQSIQFLRDNNMAITEELIIEVYRQATSENK